jgi:hypothetical protein
VKFVQAVPVTILYLLIGFDRKGDPLEILYNVIDDKTINVFHAMRCRNIYYHLLQKEEQ